MGKKDNHTKYAERIRNSTPSLECKNKDICACLKCFFIDTETASETTINRKSKLSLQIWKESEETK